MAQPRPSKNSNEQWLLTNNTNRELAISDVLTIPTIMPGKTIDLLRFATREQISYSSVLTILIKSKKVTLKKKLKGGDRIDEVESSNSRSSLLPQQYSDRSHVDGEDQGGGASSFSELTDVDLTGLDDGKLLQYDSSDGLWKPVDLSILGSYGTSDFNVDFASKTTTNLAEGTNLYFTNERVDDRIASLLVAGSNITLTYDDGAGTLTIDASGSGGSSTLSGLSDVTLTSITDGELLVYSAGNWINNTLAEAGIAADTHVHATSDITSGTFADARIAQSNVTQHQTALVITESQISDLGSYITDITGENLSSLADVTITTIATGEILKWNGTTWINNTLAEAGIASSTHTHTTSDITDFPTLATVATTGNYSDLSGTPAPYAYGSSVGEVPYTNADRDNFDYGLLTLSSGSSANLQVGAPFSGIPGHFSAFDRGSLRLYQEYSDFASLKYVGMQSPATISSTITFTLPGVYGSSGDVLTSDGTGILSWTTPSLSGFSTTDLTEGTNLYFTDERVDDRVAALLVAGSNITLVYDDGAGTITVSASGSGGSSTLAGLDDVTITTIADGNILVYDSATSDWINQSLADAGIAAASHSHLIADLPASTIYMSEITNTVDGGGEVVTSASSSRYIEQDCTIISASLIADVSGSITATISRDRGGSVTELGTVSLSSQESIRDTTLSGWTTDLDAGDILIVAWGGTIATVTHVTLTLGRNAT